MAENKLLRSILIFLVLAIGLVLINGERAKTCAQESDDAKAFKILKEKMKDPRTGLPKTLDPNLIKGKDRRGYQVAKEIPANSGSDTLLLWMRGCWPRKSFRLLC